MTALAVRELCHRWVDEVWHRGKVDLVASCVAPMYTRHEPAGTRIVTPTSYGEEILARLARTPDLHFYYQNVVWTDTHAWLRFTTRYTDSDNHTAITRACFQVYRIEEGKLAETWVAWHDFGTVWPDYQEFGPTWPD